MYTCIYVYSYELHWNQVFHFFRGCFLFFIKDTICTRNKKEQAYLDASLVWKGPCALPFLGRCEQVHYQQGTSLAGGVCLAKTAGNARWLDFHWRQNSEDVWPLAGEFWSKQKKPWPSFTTVSGMWLSLKIGYPQVQCILVCFPLKMPFGSLSHVEHSYFTSRLAILDTLRVAPDLMDIPLQVNNG